MERKRKCVITAIVLLALLTVAGFFGFGFHISKETPDCRLMEPISVGKFSRAEEIDFSNKTRISLRKFGFRKKIVVKEPSILLLEVSGGRKSGYFGIYKDAELRKPVEEVPFTWESRNGGAEEGTAEYIPNNEGKDGIVILEPGTYYAAVYTKNPFDDYVVSYLTYVGPLNEKGMLWENKSKNFYVVKEGQKNTFKIISRKDGKVRIKTNLFNQGTVRVYDEHNVLLNKKDAVKNSHNPVTVTFNAEKGQTYYVEMENCEISNCVYNMYLHEIRYTFL